MSDLQSYYDNFANTSRWMNEDPKECGCGGSGWFLSELDTWHRCDVHGTPDNARHPEDYDEPEPAPVDIFHDAKAYAKVFNDTFTEAIINMHQGDFEKKQAQGE